MSPDFFVVQMSTASKWPSSYTEILAEVGRLAELLAHCVEERNRKVMVSAVPTFTDGKPLIEIRIGDAMCTLKPGVSTSVSGGKVCPLVAALIVVGVTAPLDCMIETGSSVPDLEVVTRVRELLRSCVVGDTLRHQAVTSVPRFW